MPRSQEALARSFLDGERRLQRGDGAWSVVDVEPSLAAWGYLTWLAYCGSGPAVCE